MSLRRICRFLLFVVLMCCLVAAAEPPNGGISTPATSGDHVAVPHLIRFSGKIDGASGAVAASFALYKDQSGGAPLWLETQNLTVDQNGRYTILLGANHADGIPADLFASGEARWLGVQPDGQPEQARVLLVSVPYALKAADADSLGGKPLSAFLLAPSATSSTTTTSNTYVNTTAVTAAAYTISGTAGALALFTSASDLGSANVYQSGENFGIGTSTPQRALHIKSGAPVIKLEDTNFPNGWWELQQSAFVNETFGFLRYENPGGAMESKSFVISKDGNMGVGVGVPMRKLHLKSAGQTVIRLEDSNYPNSFWELQDAAFCDDCFGFLRYENGSSVASKSLLITAAGNFGIGTAYPITKLDVAGGIHANGAVNATSFTGDGSGLTGINAVIADGSITAAKLAAGAAVGNLADGSVSPAKITGTAATLGSNTFVGSEAISGQLSVGGVTAGNQAYHTIHAEIGQTGTTDYMNPNTPYAVWGLSTDQSGDSVNASYTGGVYGKAFGPWGRGVVGYNTDTHSFGSPRGVIARVDSSASNAMGLVTQNLGATPSANGMALYAEASSANALTAALINDNGGTLVRGFTCNGGIDQWQNCSNTNKTMTFQVDGRGAVTGNGFRKLFNQAAPAGAQMSKLAKLTNLNNGTPGTTLFVTTATTSDTTGLLGIATGTAVNNNTQQAVALVGDAPCFFDNGPPTVGDYVQASTTQAGYCHDAGLSPIAGQQVIGIVSSSTANNQSSPYSYAVFLLGSGSAGAGGSGGGGIASVNAAPGSGLTASTSSGVATVGSDFNVLQKRVNTCGNGNAIQGVNADGSVNCIGVAGGGSVAYVPTNGPASMTISPTPAGVPTPASPTYTLTVTQPQQGPAVPNGNLTMGWVNTIPAGVLGTATDTSGNVSAGVYGKGTGGATIGVAAVTTGGAPALVAYNGGSGNGSAIIAQTDGTDGEVISAESTYTAGGQCSDGGSTYNCSPTALKAKIHNSYGNVLSLRTDYQTQDVKLIDSNTGFSVDGTGRVSANYLNSEGGINAFGEIDAAGGLVTNSINTFGPCNPCTLTIQAGNVQFGGGVTISGPVHVSGGAIDGASNVSSVDGNFSGNVNAHNLNVTGTLSKASGTFKIDHPLDPENKYLYHSFVESPDMKNIYDGVVTLNARGEAWVELPSYFEALNQEFRYQLTAIGAPGPNLYVAKKVSGNRFKIAGGRRGMEVSWMVTGVRHDAYADAHRVQVEVEKTGAERGTYLHPELFKKKEGKPLNARHGIPKTSSAGQAQNGNE